MNRRVRFRKTDRRFALMFPRIVYSATLRRGVNGRLEHDELG